ncbi:MAG: DEAD/DEAH box helicase [Deltaproteobacteria bacterium]|nr:DEAD/DEAH box helicase [Deltaproteobacteria bacterium]
MRSPLLKLPNTFRAFYGAFPSLFPFQVRAIDPILQGKDLILQSGTGSGKTEAVLAPCLERVFQSGGMDRLVYVVPTRALAFDLKRRLSPIITPRLGLGFGVRTGDIKRSGGRTPHIIITTPESLDVLLGSRNPNFREFISRVSMAVIDEVHPLVHQYRGRQLALVLKRLERRAGGPLQKIALSATIADMDSIARFFDFSSTVVHLSEDVRKEIVPHLVHLKNEDEELIALFDDLYRSFGYRKILLFANSRSACDRLFALLGQQGCFSGACGLHYSNLKPKRRRVVERNFRRNPHALCVATSTLELGIDVGDVDAVVLYEPPDSVSAFLQRVGRANRRIEKTFFWGICRGAKAGEQLTRFLGLLALAKRGQVERPLPRKLISVLGQQTASCIYEKQRITPGAMEDLFPEESRDLDKIFKTMKKTGWLSRGPVNGLFQGGWQYYNCLFEYGIWSNFPPAEEDYSLELSKKTIADIPRAVVEQLEPGDRVNLAGKRLCIAEIIHAKGAGRVLALPSTRTDNKEIFWLGPGQQISYEVAQSVREVVKRSKHDEKGLFSRTRALLERERRKIQNAAVLKNGIEVILSPNGFYRYLTYMGSVGNLILRWTIRNHLRAAKSEDVFVASDAVGVDCSHRVDFSKLPLPLVKQDLVSWTEQNFKLLRASFPLNRFCSILPKELHMAEMADFLFDERVMTLFLRYREKSSEILSGSLDFLERGLSEDKPDTPGPIEIPAKGKPLLDLEKERLKPMPEVSLNCATHSNRPLTGSILAGYFRHLQCERFLRLHFVPVHHLPPSPPPLDRAAADDRINKGRQFEDTVMAHLQDNSATMVRIPERDANGNFRSMELRHRETVEGLKKLLKMPIGESAGPRYLSQGVLHENTLFQDVDGIGIPDLIRLSREKNMWALTVGEIKNSPAPRFHHKWQTAFYAFLLKKMIASREINESVAISNRGFLVLPDKKKTGKMVEHEFDLHPYLAAFPALIQNLDAILSKNARAAGFQLKRHCAYCQWFNFCYQEALSREDIQFLPNLSPGQLDQLRTLDLKSMDRAKQWLEASGIEPDRMPPHTHKQLKSGINALSNHHILLNNKITQLFPSNISTPIILLAVPGPVPSHNPTLGFRVANENGKSEVHTWEMQTSDTHKKSAWHDFAMFLAIWKEAVKNGKGPHVFSFGNRTPSLLLEWAGEMGSPEEHELIADMVQNHWTDLRHGFRNHFTLPIPGELTLYSLNHVLGLAPALKRPLSLFHGDPYDVELKDALLFCDHLRKWLMDHLISNRQQEEWKTGPKKENPSKAYIQFVKEEQRLRQEDILSLQAYSLEERVDRFRAMGPLRFTGKELDHEGKFRYNFSVIHNNGTSKFREGDFLKLVFQGTRDLQSGFSVILNRYAPTGKTLSIGSRQGHLALNRRIHYSLEEDAEDWTTPKLLHGVKAVLSRDEHPFSRILRDKHPRAQYQNSSPWIGKWLARNSSMIELNAAQRQAMGLPFSYQLSLIDGPPGTGKTHLLGWMLIALVLHAHESGEPLRIALSALTHQAIDNALLKIARLLKQFNLEGFPARLIKWGKPDEPAKDDDPFSVETSNDPEDVFSRRYLILGATGYGLYNLFDSRNGHFPPYFDWMALDEASQMLVPQAALTLAYGKGNYLLLGDVKQLPPIVLGRDERDDTEPLSPGEKPLDIRKSILEHLSRPNNTENRVRLNVTYRMNRELCRFPSHTWYNGALHPAPENAGSRLALKDEISDNKIDKLIDPDRPVTLAIMDHRRHHQECAPEADIISRIACRLITHFSVQPEQIALISPHRAQNNSISARLSGLLEKTGHELPLIDTVERVQGAERDVIIFGFTTSDRDSMMSGFLNNPNRFNVVITRARKKLIVVGSKSFFSAIPDSEKDLGNNACFKEFYEHCKERGSLFFL